MFTGIISDLGEIVGLERRAGGDLGVTIEARQPLPGLAIGASVSCSGVCLTATAVEGRCFRVDVSAETLHRTAPAQWVERAKLNLERALKVGEELGGHIVTGHVDAVGVVERVEAVEGSLHLEIAVPATLSGAMAAKGSVAIDGVSLTVNAVDDRADGGCLVHLNIIPHTAQQTTLGDCRPGQRVNIEIDVLARYLARMLEVRQAV